jgi:hypothetical protein
MVDVMGADMCILRASCEMERGIFLYGCVDYGCFVVCRREKMDIQTRSRHFGVELMSNEFRFSFMQWKCFLASFHCELSKVTMGRCGVVRPVKRRQALDVFPAALSCGYVSSCSRHAGNFFVSSTRPPVAFNHDSACAGLTHCLTLPYVRTLYTSACRTPHIASTHARIAQRLVATMSTVARGGSRGGRGRGQSAGVWRGSNTRGGLNGASTDSSDKPAFAAKKRGGGAATGGKTRNNGQELDENGNPKAK